MRLASIAARLEHSFLPADQKAELRQQLEQGMQDATAAEAAEAAAQEQADRAQHETEAAEQNARIAAQEKAIAQQADQRRKTLEAQRAAQAEEEQRQAEEQARNAAETQRKQAKEQEQAKAAAAVAERYYQQHQGQLTPEVVSLLAKNPALKPQTARDDVVAKLGIVEAGLFALDACRAHDAPFSDAWAETQRRVGLLQQLLLNYYGMTANELTQGAAARRSRIVANLQENLNGDEGYRTQMCNTVIPLTSNLLDFSQ